MNVNDTATLRKKLQTWQKRLAVARYPEFHFTLKQFWNFLRRNPVLDPICNQLEGHKPPPPHGNWDGLLTPFFIRHFEQEKVFFPDEENHAAFCYHVVMHCVHETHANFPNDKLQIELEFARRYHPNPPLADQKWLYGHFVNNIIRPLIIHFTETLEESMSMLTILQRYKHKCEWFQRESLDQLWRSNSTKGEEKLKMHLYEYLYDNGVSLTIEPSSPLGEVDFLTDDLSADAKLVRDSGDKRGIIKGFHQVYKYTQDHERTCGYLVVFNATDKDIKIAHHGSHQESLFLVHNGRRIYISTVDICPKPVSASKRGPLRHDLEITEEDLISSEIK